MILLLTGVVLLLLLASEVGFHLGSRWADRVDPDAKIVILTLASTILGMPALLLGFAFSMAVARYDSRRMVIVDEANAIGTSYLRAGMLEEPDRSALRQELRRYVDTRITIYDAGRDPAESASTKAESDATQIRMWRLAASAAMRNPAALPPALLLQSLNDMIDLDTRRSVVFLTHVPPIIPALLVFTSALGSIGIGTRVGFNRRRAGLFTTMLCVLVASIIFVILDLDRPQSGLIRVSQTATLELRDRIDRASR